MAGYEIGGFLKIRRHFTSVQTDLTLVWRRMYQNMKPRYFYCSALTGWGSYTEVSNCTSAILYSSILVLAILYVCYC